MSAIIDQVELSEAPTVTLGGRDWKIPKLAARQNKLVITRLLSLAAFDAQNPTDDQMEKLYSSVFIALTRAYPSLTRDEFDDLPISYEECMKAFPIIADAAGLIPKNPPTPAAEATQPA